MQTVHRLPAIELGVLWLTDSNRNIFLIFFSVSHGFDILLCLTLVEDLDLLSRRCKGKKYSCSKNIHNTQIPQAGRTNSAIAIFMVRQEFPYFGN